MLDEKHTGLCPNRSIKVADTDEFPTLGLAKIEMDTADKETFSLKQRLAGFRKLGLYYALRKLSHN